MILDAQSRNNLTCMSQCSGNGCHVGSIQTPGYRLGYHTVVMVTGIITFFLFYHLHFRFDCLYLTKLHMTIWQWSLQFVFTSSKPMVQKMSLWIIKPRIAAFRVLKYGYNQCICFVNNTHVHSNFTVKTSNSRQCWVEISN
jgi:hypothetical protein